MPAGASAQSLGELAKQEEARRKAIRTPGKVYTNESLRPEPRTSSPTATLAAPGQASEAATASGAAPPTPSGQTPPAAREGQPAAEATPTPPGPRQDEAAWRKRVQTERDLQQRAQMFADALQSRINALSTDFVNRDDPAQRAQIAGDRQKALAELDRVRQEIQQHSKAIAGIQEEARKAGVPAGWVR
jgi:hypothetical protein